MARAAVIGEALQVQGFALAGAVVCPVGGRDEARTAWRSLSADIAVVVLTPGALDWLRDELERRPDVLPVVMRA